MTRADTFGFYISRIGLDDGKGNLSFNKIVTAVMIVLLYTIVLRGIDLKERVLDFAEVVLFASFGIKGLSLVGSVLATWRHQRITAPERDSE